MASAAITGADNPVRLVTPDTVDARLIWLPDTVIFAPPVIVCAAEYCEYATADVPNVAGTADDCTNRDPPNTVPLVT